MKVFFLLSSVLFSSCMCQKKNSIFHICQKLLTKNFFPSHRKKKFDYARVMNCSSLFNYENYWDYLIFKSRCRIETRHWLKEIVHALNKEIKMSFLDMLHINIPNWFLAPFILFFCPNNRKCKYCKVLRSNFHISHLALPLFPLRLLCLLLFICWIFAFVGNMRLVRMLWLGQ